MRLAALLVLALLAPAVADAGEATMRGFVRDPAGAPVAGVEVLVQREGLRWAYAAPTQVDGSYAHAVDEPGCYRVKVAHRDWTPCVEVEAGGEAWINVTLAAAARVVGQVLSAEGVGTDAYVRVGEVVTRTDPQGSFDLVSPEGLFAVEAWRHVPGLEPAWSWWTTCGDPAGECVRVPATGVVRHDLRLPPAGVVAVTLRESPGQGVAGLDIMLGTLGPWRTGESGRVRVEVPYGAYEVRVTSEGRHLPFGPCIPSPCVVEVDAAPVEIVVPLGSPYGVLGDVRDARGRPLAGERVVVRAGGAEQVAETNAFGGYSAAVPPGEVFVALPGNASWVDARCGPGFSACGRVAVQETGRVDLAHPATGRVVVRARGADGAPFAGADATLQSAYVRLDAAADGDGVVDARLPVGVYSVALARGDEEASCHACLHVEPEGTLRLDLRALVPLRFDVDVAGPPGVAFHEAVVLFAPDAGGPLAVEGAAVRLAVPGPGALVAVARAANGTALGAWTRVEGPVGRVALDLARVALDPARPVDGASAALYFTTPPVLLGRVRDGPAVHATVHADDAIVPSVVVGDAFVAPLPDANDTWRVNVRTAKGEVWLDNYPWRGDAHASVPLPAWAALAALVIAALRRR